jgi:hypothetical protein
MGWGGLKRGSKKGESSGGVKALTGISRPGAGQHGVAGGGQMRRRCSRDRPTRGRRGS